MSSLYAIHKVRAFLRGTLGIAAIVFGVLIKQPVVTFVVVAYGTLVAASAYTRLIRIYAQEQRSPDLFRQAHESFARASLPRQVFWLLFAVAEADGRPENDERELVRKFLLERFVDPITTHDLRTWEAQRIPPEQVGALAMQVRRVLLPAECETIFYWACLVAFADGTFRPLEHEALQDVSKGLGLDPQQARAVFHHAKARVLGGGDPSGTRTWGRANSNGWQHGPRGAHYGGQRHDRAGQGSRRAPTRVQALAMLGLEGDPSDDDIRKRHRELVKRYHPDAHAHLGEVAAAEAAKRFREVQKAYEYLVP